MGFAEKIYNTSPIWFQDIMISSYGLKLHIERNIGNKNEILKKLEKTQWMSPEQIIEYQNTELNKLIFHAYQNVVYYRELFSNHGLVPHDIKTVDDLKKIPILNKETIRTQSESLRATNNIGKVIMLGTSGTTGTSLKIPVDIFSRRSTYAFMARYYQWMDLESDRGGVTFGGRTVVPTEQNRKVFWRYNAIKNNWLFSSFHLSPQNLPYYVEKLKEIQPIFIESYPSSIYVIAQYMYEKKIYGITPQVILTSSETLGNHQRELIEEMFNCKIFDQYGCTEQAMFISQCENGCYHVHPEYGIVEILDDDGRPVSPGEIGRVVCTSFTNKAMPFIRYDIGDSAMQGRPQQCCGRHFPTITKLFGRKDDFIITPEGTKVGRLDPIFKGLNSIRLSQIVQTSVYDVTIKLVPGENYTKKDEVSLVSELKKRIGMAINVKVEIVSDIPKTSSGKFQSVVSNISN